MASDSTRFWFDAFSAVLLLATALIGAYLPKYLQARSGGGANMSSSHSLAFHLGNMLSAGVMLSAGFCHLLADAHAHRGLLFVGKRFPMANFLAASGYILTLLADQIVQQITHGSPPEPGAASGSGGSSSEYRKLPSSMELSTAAADTDAAESGALPVSTPIHLEANGIGGSHRHAHAVGMQKRAGDADGSKLPLLSAAAVAAGSGTVHAAQQAEDCHAGVAAFLGGRKKLSFATAVLLACALCIHSILEGMALGAQTSMRSTEDIMIAIAAHKGLAAYALGASVLESGPTNSRFWTVIGLFSVATPVGIFVGYGMSTGSKSLVGAALSALASGTFLYVAFMEVIPKELADGRHRMLKMAAFLLGYGLMSLLAIWA